MINAKELRIGNYVQHEPYPDEIWQIDFKLLESIDLQLVECVGIPLTPEILLNCGFEEYMFYSRSDVVYKFGKYFIAINGWFHLATSEESAIILNYEIKYLHQLQNLIFALTGTELTIKM